MDFFVIFIEGLASFLSPCVLPMLPMYVSYFAGEDKNLKKVVINSLWGQNCGHHSLGTEDF